MRQKKNLLIAALLATASLMSACGKQTDRPEMQAAETPSVMEEETGQTINETRAVILENAQNLGGGLWYIPNQAVEATSWPTLEGFQGNLLLSQAENSDGTNADMHITLIDSRTGETLAETIREMPHYQMPKAGRDVVACLEGDDRITVTFLNEKLEEVSAVTVDDPCFTCYLSPDGKTLYTMAYDAGIAAIDLATGARQEILTDGSNLDSYTACGTYVPIAYDDVATTMRVYGSLNLETGKVELSPCQEASSRLMRWDNVWQTAVYNDPSLFRVGTDEHPDYLCLENGELRLLENGKLLSFYYMTGNMAIYETDGSCLSTVALPEELQFNTGVSPVWSEELGGYFFLVFNDHRNSRLLFWDISEKSGAEQNLNLISWDNMHESPGGKTADPSLYPMAETISKKYGVMVSIADQCTHEFSDFTYAQLHDSTALSEGLACVERALSCYPEGMLSQLAYGPVRNVQIYLAADLKGGEYFGNERSYYGFTNEDGSDYYIVLDAGSICEENIFHEISHIIDRKLSYDASLRPNAQYSEAGWQKLQPEGFEFLYDYSQIPARPEAYFDWFVDDYSQSYPTEDRARIMEYAMSADFRSQAFQESPHLMAKLQYYSDCIRDCFDTTGWPEITQWEKPLHMINE